MLCQSMVKGLQSQLLVKSSLGILLLEMFTGRSATDDMFRDSLDLHKFTKDALPVSALEIADSTIWLHKEPQDNIIQSRIQECLVCLQAWHILLKATASTASINKKCGHRDACKKKCIPHVCQSAYTRYDRMRQKERPSIQNCCNILKLIGNNPEITEAIYGVSVSNCSHFSELYFLPEYQTIQSEIHPVPSSCLSEMVELLPYWYLLQNSP